MKEGSRGRVAILYSGNSDARRNATRENTRFSALFRALGDRGLRAEPVVYHDDFCEEVRRQLMEVDGVLAWVNPIHDGRDRTILDSLLREIAHRDIYVSAHPDVILKIGTKEVLYRTRELGWGSDTHLYRSMEEMRGELPSRLAGGQARVLKQHRGNGGIGVWRIQLPVNTAALPQPETPVLVCHAKRGCVEEEISLGEFLARCEPYFAADGRMIDQAWQPRLAEGMIRCYLVHDTVAGFGHQAVNALFPAPPGAPPGAAPPPGPRLYHPPSLPQFQSLKRRLEQEWVPAMQRLLGIETESLPILWDCDFLLGPVGDSGEDSHVLCEINVSSVAPFPESAVPYVADATVARLHEARRRRGRAA